MKFIKKSISIVQKSTAKLVIKKIIPNKVYNGMKEYFLHDPTLRICYGNSLVTIDIKKKTVEGLMLISYWDGVPNFGDVIGPYLISKITDKPVLNIFTEKLPGLLTVGSILQTINRNDMTVWGSGLANKPTKETIEKLKKYNPKILSVRGEYTAKSLSDAGIKVPNNNVYGDPALVLPLFYNPTVDKKTKVGLCPHFTHKEIFEKNVIVNSNLKFIDVQRDVENVVYEIISSSVCVSTSLHGLIIAQAYGIPWVWLEIEDNRLGFDDFKFKDFFSMLEENQVSHIKASLGEIQNLDFDSIAEKASLPNKRYNEESILECLTIYFDQMNS